MQASDFTKKCQRCKIEKHCSEFTKRPEVKGGYRATCKVCRKLSVKLQRGPMNDEQRAKSRAKYQKNKEKERIRRAKRYLRNKDKLNARNEAWKKANPDKYKEMVRRAYTKKDKQKNREWQKEWRRKNPEKYAIYRQNLINKHGSDYHTKMARKRVANDPEKARMFDRNRKARLRGAIGKHSSKDVAKLLHLQKGKCIVCKKDISKNYTVDHIQPLYLGGTNWPDNIQLLCVNCNCSKNKKDPIEFMQSRGFLI